MKHAKVNTDRIVGIICIIISGFFGWASMHIKASLNPGDPGAKLFPLIGCGILLVAGIGLLLRNPGSEAQDNTFLTPEQWKRAGILFAMYILYCLMLWLLGFTLAVAIMLFLMCILFTGSSLPQQKKGITVLKSFVYAIGVGALIYLLYVVALDSVLPRGLIWNMIGR